MFKMTGKYTEALITIDSVDETTVTQVQSMLNHPATTGQNIAIMPDCHAGKGCVIGFTMKMGDKVVPNWVGVDIGCGMLSTKFNILSADMTNEKMALIDTEIHKVIPMGKNVNTSITNNLKENFMKVLFIQSCLAENPIVKGFSVINLASIEKMVTDIGMNLEYFWNSLGSLGGGNHFIEIGKDDGEGLWLTIHTGSRNFGKTVCEYFDKKAQDILSSKDLSGYIAELKDKAKRGEIENKDINRLFEEKKKSIKYDFDIRSSAYVEGDVLNDYLKYMFLAQVYSMYNRLIITNNILSIIGDYFGRKLTKMMQIETIHNYISFDDQIVRKGAIASYANQKMIIPFNMRDGLLVVEGKSNNEWNNSAPHGAGRVFSRSQAKDVFTLEEYQKTMNGIFSTSVVESTLDESPMAYKDAAVIEKAIEPTAKIIWRVKPIYNVKAK